MTQIFFPICLYSLDRRLCRFRTSDGSMRCAKCLPNFNACTFTSVFSGRTKLSHFSQAIPPSIQPSGSTSPVHSPIISCARSRCGLSQSYVFSASAAATAATTTIPTHPTASTATATSITRKLSLRLHNASDSSGRGSCRSRQFPFVYSYREYEFHAAF